MKYHKQETYVKGVADEYIHQRFKSYVLISMKKDVL